MATPTTTKDILNTANPATIAPACQKVALGTVLDCLSTPTTETALAAVADVITLAAIPLFVQDVNVLTVGGGGGPVQRYIPIGAGLTPSSGYVAIDYAAKTLTFAAADKVATATVTYIKFPAASRTALAANLPE